MSAARRNNAPCSLDSRCQETGGAGRDGQKKTRHIEYMTSRTALLVALAGGLLLPFGTPGALAQRVPAGSLRLGAVQLPPPMFSLWYAGALRGLLDIAPAEAAGLEQQLTHNPKNHQMRLKLMAFYSRANRASRPQDVAAQAPRGQEARAGISAARIRRLPVDAFPQLPPAVAAALRARNCAVPQPALEGPPRNVISGQFFAKGETGWAVLCSVNNVTSLLAFRNGKDRTPATIITTDDQVYLQTLSGNRVVYSREITAVGRDFIMRHYRAYGGPQPPPVDHQGIDDAFLEKASVIWYFHRGRWLRLTGAD